MRVKVCGMTLEQQVNELHGFGVDFAGFIFYPKSKRYVFKHMSASQLKSIRNINKVGVFVNSTFEEVLQMVDECGLHIVQLHGDESPRLCEKIADYISVIKAFRLSDDDNIEWKIRDYRDVVDMYMFDTLGAGYGGTGKKFDWQMLSGLEIKKPFLLSGGIEFTDLERLRIFKNESVAKDLFALDINSKFEIMPGVKDMRLIERFCEELALV